ncbi:hypothetical protein TL16_g11053, partial [Triparma laevis f. inornata]
MNPLRLLLLLLLLHLPTTAPSPIPPHHEWRFQNCVTGNSVMDTGSLQEVGATPHGGDGAGGNPVFGTNGARFDGVDDFYNFGAAPDWTWGGSFSMAVYIKYDRFTVGHGMIFDFGTEDGTYTDEDGNSVSADSVMLYDIAGDDSWDNSRIAFQIDGGPGEGYKYTSEGNFEELTWTHIVLTVKDNTMRTYKNGVKVDENLDGWEPRSINRRQSAIGTWNGGVNPDYFFDGTIGYMQMWYDVELTQSEITELYDPHNHAHHFWDFRGCFTGSPVIDEMTGDLAATPINSALCSSEGMIFDGVNDYVDLDWWGWGGAVSIEIYFKFNEFQSYSTLFHLGGTPVDGGGYYDDSIMVYTYESEPDLMQWLVYEGEEYSAMYSSFQSNLYPERMTMLTTQWTQLVFTVDGENGDAKVYRDGELDASKSGGKVPKYANRNAPSLGSYSEGSGGFFKGTIGYFKVSHVELSASSIREQYYCPSGYFGSKPAGCTVCPTGKYSGYPSTLSCFDCEAGKSTTTGTDAEDHDSPTDCADCSAGGYSSAGSQCTVCPSGKYSGSAGSASCAVCPSGTYLSDQATSPSLHNSVSSCRACSAGKKLSDNGSDASYHDHPDDCVACTPGSYAGSGAPSCTECEAGKSSPAGASACSTCPSGYVCGETNEPCGAGLYSNGGTDGCVSCEKGHSCPGGTDRSPCFPGSWQGSTSQSTCKACPGGKYQNVAGQDACIDCPAGYFCPERTTDPIACGNVALYCPANTAQIISVNDGYYTIPRTGERGKRSSCNGNGEYSDEAELKACKIAPAGKKPNGDHADVVDCDAGSYSVGNSNSCLLCGEGETSVAGAASCNTCAVCGVGKYKIADCSPGEETMCGNCVKGQASMGGGATACTECNSRGKYSDVDGASVCKTASAGTKPNEARDGVESCAPGTISVGGADECSVCNAGETSGEGAAGCRTCATCGLGTYQIAECTSEVETQCGVCVAGKASMGGAVEACTECDGPGEYSEGGASVCNVARAGYKPKGSGELKTGIEMCEKNTFSIGAKDECEDCQEGGHSPAGSSACEQCLTGKYFDEDENKCEKCPVNTHSVSGATTLENCEVCDVSAGEWSNEGAGYCERCPQYEVYNMEKLECECLDTFMRGVNGKCTCKVGETLMGTKCELCEKVKWKGVEGVVSCNYCKEMLEGSTTKSLGSVTNSSCVCPAGKFNNMHGKCEDVMEGIDAVTPGMTLADMEIRPEYWRTSPTSIDVRECPVPEACVGGNRSDENGLCLEGHSGPYCNLCVDGWAKDPFLICKKCDIDVTSVALTILVVVVMVGAGVCLYYVVKAKLQGGNGTVWKRLKNGGKILFTGFQITASLPAVVPAIPMPETFKEAVKTIQFLNADLFQFVSAGCWSGNFNFYNRVLAVTLPIMLACGLLIVLGRRSRGQGGSRFYNVAIAITYLTLPAVTTTVFGIFSCDELDDKRDLLRVDYSIDCEEGMRPFWLFYGVIMVLVFPVGVSGAYFSILYVNREKIKQREEEREQDLELMNIAFLFDPYKPEFWYFEVVETLRRLLMTGALSSVRPGSFTQLSWGMSLSIFFTVLLATIKPYSESRDNWIAILSSGLLILVFLASSFMKYNQHITEDSYDAQGMDVLLILSYVTVFVLFLWWAFYQKDDLKPSATTIAKNVLKGKGSSSFRSSMGESQQSFGGGEGGGGSKRWLGPIERIGSYLKEREKASYEKEYKKKPKADLGLKVG